MITDSEDRSMITELEQIIQTEEAKPEAERDENLIDDCIHEIAELKGVKAEYSDEEIDKIMDRLVKATEQKKKRKRFIRLAAGIAAAFVIVSGVTACAINPALINWIERIVRMPFGSTVVQDKITYSYQGLSEDYGSIEELLRSNNLDVYYPSILPNGIIIKYVEIVETDGTKFIGFRFNTDDLHYTIQIQYPDSAWGNEVVSEIEANGYHFNVYSVGENYVSHSEIDGNAYIIQSKNMNDIIMIIGGLRKELK